MFASVECPECSKTVIRHSLRSHLVDNHSSGSQEKLKDRIIQLEKEVQQGLAHIGIQDLEIQELREEKESLETKKEQLKQEKIN